MKTKQYFAEALKGVESQSIRNWATSEHNNPLFLEVARIYMDKGRSVSDLTLYIVANAIGLW